MLIKDFKLFLEKLSKAVCLNSKKKELKIYIQCIHVKFFSLRRSVIWRKSCGHNISDFFKRKKSRFHLMQELYWNFFEKSTHI